MNHERRNRIARALGALGLLALAGLSPARGAEPATSTLAGLKELSLEQLMDLEVSTVSRKEERWWSAPSGIDVVTGEEIRRAGARNLPDALRLATGVHVAQSSAKSWAVSLRGMNVLAANKIAVMMDGRSLFTPFFSGVLWDAQDTLIEDIDRIEVVRGPIGALWGAFAVNGLVQILTKPAWDTQGWLASAGTGTEDPAFVSMRYGGQAGESTYYRAYAKYHRTDWTYDSSGRHAQPATDFFQAGFRMDAARAEDTTLTLQGDYYTNHDIVRGRVQSNISGVNLLGNWRRVYSSDRQAEVRAYYDETYRSIPLNFEENRRTVSVAAKYRFASGRHDVQTGFDGQVSWDEIGNNGIAQLEPDERRIQTAGVYVQDEITLVPQRTRLTLAVKAEDGSFTGVEFQPTARLAWTPNPRTTAWTAVSRAVRTPVRVDEDLVLRLGGLTFFEANDAFKTEHAVAFEAGVRHQPVDTLMFDVSAFTYRYDDLRSTEPTGTVAIPLTFRNTLNAESTGAELTVMYQPWSRLFVKGSYRYLDMNFFTDPGSRHTTAGQAEGNDPRHLATLGAHLDLPGNVEVDAYVRHVSELPDPATPAYTALDLRAAWRWTPTCEIEVAARNLLDRQHPELVTTNSLNEEVRRSCTVKVTWRY